MSNQAQRNAALVAERDRLREVLSEIRSYLLACIGDAEGQKAVQRHRMLRLTAGQVQALAETLALVDAALRVTEQPSSEQLSSAGAMDGGFYEDHVIERETPQPPRRTLKATGDEPLDVVNSGSEEWVRETPQP